MKLCKEFYLNENVLEIAKNLLGKVLVTSFNNQITSGIIIETEAYEGTTDKASHAFGGKFTQRTKPMFDEGGIAYVYLCYGIHSLFNIVTNKKNIPHAVLIRAIHPLQGIDIMTKRIGLKLNKKSGSGPGKVSKLLGIHYSHSSENLTGKNIWIEDQGLVVPENEILTTKRIGVSYAGEDANLPYRFVWSIKKHIQY